MEGGVMTADKRIAICPVCNKFIVVRWAIFANDSLSRHMKAEHK